MEYWDGFAEGLAVFLKCCQVLMHGAEDYPLAVIAFGGRASSEVQAKPFFGDRVVDFVEGCIEFGVEESGEAV